MYTAKNLQMTSKKVGTEILMRLSEQSLELETVFKEASRKLIIILLYCITRQPKNKKIICA
jgi:hypothetical protein